MGVGEEQASPDVEAALTEWLPRCRAVVVGPGLGRDPAGLAAARRAIAMARGGRDGDGAPRVVVVDADGLWALSASHVRCSLSLSLSLSISLSLPLAHPTCPSPPPLPRPAPDPSPIPSPSPHPPQAPATEGGDPSLVAGWGRGRRGALTGGNSSRRSHVVLTPNGAELPRLARRLGLDADVAGGADGPAGDAPGARLAAAVARRLGGRVVVVAKGAGPAGADVIAWPRGRLLCGPDHGGHPGSPRRCGGLGDLLAGCAGVLGGWAAAADGGAGGGEKEGERDDDDDDDRYDEDAEGSEGRRAEGRSAHPPPPPRGALGAYAACALARRAAQLSYEERGRGALASDAVERVDAAARELGLD